MEKRLGRKCIDRIKSTKCSDDRRDRANELEITLVRPVGTVQLSHIKLARQETKFPLMGILNRFDSEEYRGTDDDLRTQPRRACRPWSP